MSQIVGALFDGGDGASYARVDPDNPTVIHFVDATCGPNCRIEIMPQNPWGRPLRFIEADVIITFLGTPDIPISGRARCFETRPADAAGPSESPVIVQYGIDTLYAGTIFAAARYNTNGRPYMSVGLTLVEQPS